MKITHLSRGYSLFLSFALLVAPLPLSAVAKAMADRSAIAQDITKNISEFEADIIAQNPRISYVYLGKELSDIAQVIAQLSDLDEQENSPLHELNAHIKNGFSLAEYNATVETLEYAALMLRRNHTQLDSEYAEKISADLDEIIQQVVDGSLTRLRTLVIDENINVLGKATFAQHIKTKQGIHTAGKLEVGKSATFKKNVND